MKYTIKSDYVIGTEADSWTEFVELLNDWLDKGPSLDPDDFFEVSRAFAARAVLLAGGEISREND